MSQITVPLFSSALEKKTLKGQRMIQGNEYKMNGGENED